MRLSLSSEQAQAGDSPPRHSWLSLPGLCCQAAGGNPQEGDRAAAAWALLYTAAHLFDSVQDGDPADPWWQPLGPGPAINVATGLLTSAWLVLDQLGLQRPVVQQLIQDAQATVLQMASGQHLDLTESRPSLRTAWAIAEAKSGAFFGLACQSGARLASAPQPVIDHYREYGLNLGLIVQIGDDLEDIQAGRSLPPLPMAYCMEMASGADDSGVHLYLATKLALFRARALEALDAAGAAQPAKDQLTGLIRSLVPAFEAIPHHG